jgi:hypothetical protein
MGASLAGKFGRGPFEIRSSNPRQGGNMIDNSTLAIPPADFVFFLVRQPCR